MITTTIVNAYSETTEDIDTTAGIDTTADIETHAESASPIGIPSNLTIIDSIGAIDVFLDTSSFGFLVKVIDEYVPISKENIDVLKKNSKSFEKIKMSIVDNTDILYKTGDRVLMYGPTGTGKTYTFLSAVNTMKEAGLIDEHCIVSITDGMEDIDFVAKIVPTETGIKYVEKEVVHFLKRAAEGSRVAMCLDELNRGGKSFLNMVLKMLDAVDGENYYFYNFITDENIVIPINNIMFFATMNLGGKYVGTSALDEALFDRFSMVKYQGYNIEVEKEMIKSFGLFATSAKKIIEYVRDQHKSGEIRSPISTRGVKMWAEAFLNSSKDKADFFSTFDFTILHRLCSVDDFGNPNETELMTVMAKFKELDMIG